MATVTSPKVKRAQSAGSMRFSLNYIMKKEKTESKSGKVLISGKNCQPELAYRQFMATKALEDKTDGRMYYHYVQSFKPEENVTPEKAHEIALELADYFKGFEVVVSTHTDRAHIHSHLIINSVSQETGKKLHLDNKSIFRIRDYSDGLCLKHGLSVLKKSVPKKDKVKSMSRSEYRAQMRGPTTKSDLIKTINEAMQNCMNKDEFLRFMEERNYEVKWIGARRNITYTCPDGKKFRDDNLHDGRFLKENMQLEFDLRQTGRKEQNTGWEFTYRQERTINEISEATLEMLRLAGYVSKMSEDDDETEDLQTFMIMTGVGVAVAIELAKMLTKIPKDELCDESVAATVEEHQMIQRELDYEEEQDQGFGGMSM